MTQPTLRHRNHTGLVEAYSRRRSTCAESVLTALLALASKPAAEIDAVDVGAGTGIWTRMLARAGCRSAVAVEPNDEMRRFGAEKFTEFLDYVEKRVSDLSTIKATYLTYAWAARRG